VLLPASSLRARTAATTTAAALALAVTASVTTAIATAVSTAAPAQAASSVRVDADPLGVRIASVSPAVIPRRGRITVTGTVTNDSEEQWRVIRVYALTSTTPFTTPEELTAAAESDPAVPFGARITDEGAFDTIDVLDPGEAGTFTISVTRDQLGVSGEPGVYWLGVHALGETDAGREEVPVADGRDRVFVPLRDPPTTNRARSRPPRTLDTALVASIRHPVSYTGNGRVTDPDGWTEDLAPTGPLGQDLSLASGAGARPMTWLVDPAVTDAVAHLAAGNRPRSLDDTVPTETDDGESQSPGDSPSGDPAGASPSPSQGSAAPSGSSARALASAPAGWLARLRTAIITDELLTLPYGDTDVAAAADSDPGMYQLARARADRRNEALDLPAGPAVAPPGGRLDQDGFDLVPESTTTLVADTVLADDARAPAPAAINVQGRRAYVADTAVLEGSGPGQRSMLDVRQRLISEALVRMLDRRGPLVVSLPTGGRHPWDAATAADLFGAIDTASWIRLTTLRGLDTQRARRVAPSQLIYPRRVARQQLPSQVFASARELMARGDLLDNILPLNDTVGGQVTDEALTSVSYDDRTSPGAAISTNAGARSWIDLELSRITVETPPSVTLSSESGQLSADVVNGLDHTVRVRIQAATDPSLEITPTPVQELGPGERATVRMEATASDLSVHTVELVVADESGQPVGTAATFPLRANRVSQVIWFVIGGGVLLLFTTIGVRLFQRIRRGLAGRRAHGRTSTEATS
jgi:Family of unknown function (DUF6049)